jgi:hypothetical protein
MTEKMKKTRIVLLLLFITVLTIGAKPFTVHGYVKDGATGEALIGANVYVKGTTTGTSTNVYGFYSLTLEEGNYTLVYTFVGYDDMETELVLNKDETLTMELPVKSNSLEEVVVRAEKKNDNITNTKVGYERLDAKFIEHIPMILGEMDVIKSLQLMPGVVATGEVSTNLSIRGGGRDQNLIQLDEGTVYNPSHLLGLFSTFNNDAIKNVELYKGIMPAQYGGRLSSLIDVRMKEGNSKEFTGTGGIGLLSTRLTLETPIVKDKGSIMVAGRRMYIDMLTKAAHKIAPKKVSMKIPVYFYDFNAKANYSINENNRIYLSGYFGRDVADLSIDDENSNDTEFGNYTGTLRWNHIFSNKLFSNFTLITSNYDYALRSKSTIEENDEEKIFTFDWTAQLKDIGAKADFGYFLNPNNTLRFGASSVYHQFDVGKVSGKDDTVSFKVQLPRKYALENAFYLGNDQKKGPFTLNYGLRITLFQNMGKTREYEVKNYQITDTFNYKKNEIYNNEWGFEPRFSATYQINPATSVKLGYARTMQYVHIASSSESGTPLDVWMPVSEYVKPQVADIFSVGYFRNLKDNKIQVSAETYYKDMQNVLDFREFSQPYLNPRIDEDFRFGKGRAYGFELMAKIPEGQLSGWVSYSLSRSERKVKGLQEKGWYLSPFDITHNLSVVGQYQVSERVFFSGNFVLMSGKPFNSPSARWEHGGKILPYYDGKNTSRHPAYHRMDIGIEIKNKPRKNYQGSWVFSIYNVYKNRNHSMIYFKQNDDGLATKAYSFSLLPRIPSVTYNFTF